MKNKRSLVLLLGLLSVLISVSLVMTACDLGGKEAVSTTLPQQTQPAPGQTTAPQETDPEVTEPAPTDSAPTEPEETEPQVTEPEETEPSGGSTGPDVNTGTGGGYNPGTSSPTEPEDATEPAIVVPAPGTEGNAYVEYFQEPSARFTTVTIPAGGQMYYRIKTAGSFLKIQDPDASVVYDGTTYLPVEGVIDITLPGDDSQVLSLQFENKSAQEKAFSVEILDAPGTQTNPISVDSIQEIQTVLDAANADGVYYRWMADCTGVLQLSLGQTDGDALVSMQANGETVALEEGRASLSVTEGDEVIIRIAAGEGDVPATQIRLTGYVAVIVDLTVSRIPFEVETVTIPGGESVIYRIRGVWGRTLMLADGDFRVLFDGVEYVSDADGIISVKLPAGSGYAELEIFNDSPDQKATMLSVNFYLGHELNVHVLTQLGELETSIPYNQNGYYYTYQVPHSGIAAFQVWRYPEIEGAKTNIEVTNLTSGDKAALLDADGNPNPDETASVIVNADDQLEIRVSVTDAAGTNLEASALIYGALYGSQEMPIIVSYPGFTAYVPAGETLYYSGFNMNGMILTASGENMQIGHNGEIYDSADGQITFGVTASGRDPAVFAITNTGGEKASFTVTFAYPVGHAENPDRLQLGTNVLIQQLGAADYYYTFTAPRAGTLTFTFDGSANWMYAVDNMTQGIYCDTQWSDSDPQVAQMAVTVKAKDVIRIRVNTYDPANMFETPAGTVEFTASYLSGPTVIESFYMPTTATLMPGEGGMYTGNFYGYVLRVSGDKNSYLVFNGVTYYADATGTIKLDMPASGTDPLSFVLYNGAAQQVNLSILFSTTNVGSAENPEKITVGSYSMVQSIEGGADYYYQFVADRNGRLTITFEADVDAIFTVNGNITRYTHMGQTTYVITVRPGAKINLSVNTYDPTNPMVSPIGTVDFTVELK